MPPTFPSHQGLVAPLWRRWPDVFDAPALFIGAAMPDVVDGLMGLYHGVFGQRIGHTLAGLPLFSIPGGLVLWFLAHYLARRVPAWPRQSFLARIWNTGRRAFLDAPASGIIKGRWGRVLLSLCIGAFSHLFFDLISHGKLIWFYPWWIPERPFPSWWYIAWAHIPAPGYETPYPVGPHLMIWLFLGALGAWLLFYPMLRQPSEDTHRQRRRPSR